MAKDTADKIVPNTEVTCTIIKAPTRPASRKTIERLMWMQPQAKKTFQCSNAVVNKRTSNTQFALVVFGLIALEQLAQFAAKKALPLH